MSESVSQSVSQSVSERTNERTNERMNENIDKLERVQRRAARYVCNNYSYEASVTAMMNQLNWIPLQQRRQNIRLCWMYKITYGLVAVPLENYLALATRQSRHYNSMAYKIFSPRHDYYKHSFFPRTVIEWNRLPDTTVKASTNKTDRYNLTEILLKVALNIIAP